MGSHASHRRQGLLSLTAARSLRSLASARAPDRPAARGRGRGLRPKRLLSLTAVRSLRSLASAWMPDRPAARGRGLGLRPKKDQASLSPRLVSDLAIEVSREDGRVVTTNLILVWVVARPSLIPWHQAAEGFGPPPPSRCLSPRRPVPYPPLQEEQEIYGRPVCRSGRPDSSVGSRRACRPVGRPQDRGTASTVGGHRPPSPSSGP